MPLVVSQAGTQTWASTGTKSISLSVSAGDVIAVIVGATDPATTVTSWTDNLGGTWTLGPSSPVSTGNLRGVTAWKVCAGGETSVSFDIGTGTTGQAFAVKVTGFAGTATLEASNENEGGLSSVSTSIGTNAASNSTATAVAIALFTSDRADTVQDVSRSYSNSFTEVGFNGSSGSRAGAFAAAKVLSSAASQSTTFTTGDTGDEMYSAILVFGDVTGGGSVESGAGSSAGAATASAVGASTAAAAGTSAGQATVAGTGASTVASAATSAGAATASGVGASTAEAAGTSAGSATASAVGDVAGGVQSGAGTSAGTSTASAVGASTAASAGTAAGTSTAAGVGSSSGGVEAGVGTAAGQATAAGVGASTAEAVGSSAGVATASAVGTDAAAQVEAASIAGLRVYAAREAQFFFSKRRPARRMSRRNWPALRAA